MTMTGTATLWRSRGFVLYWTAGTVSLAGSSVTAIVLPVACVTLLHATPSQMSILFSVGIVAPLLLQVLVGSRADRSARPRHVMCGVDLAAGVVIAVIPALWWWDALTFPTVLGVMAVASVLGVFRNAYSLPVLLQVVDAQQLTRANGMMNGSRSAMEVVGKGIAGLLLAVMAAPLAVLVDAVSFLIASVVDARIPIRRGPPRDQTRTGQQPPIKLSSLAQALARRTDLWALLLIAFVNGLTEAVFLLYCIRRLELHPALVATLFAVGAIGGVLGGLTVGAIVERFGRGSAIIIGIGGTIGSIALLPFVGPGLGAVIAVVLFELLGAFGGTIALAVVFSHIQQSAASGSVARTMGMSDNALQLAMLVGLLLGGRLGDAVSLSTPIGLALVVLVLVGLPLSASFRTSAV